MLSNPWTYSKCESVVDPILEQRWGGTKLGKDAYKVIRNSGGITEVPDKACAVPCLSTTDAVDNQRLGMIVPTANGVLCATSFFGRSAGWKRTTGEMKRAR